MDYSLCHKTVTVYHRQADAVTRQVLTGVYYVQTDCHYQESWGVQQKKKFLLIVPGQRQMVFAGDRIFEGVGDEVADWDSLMDLPEVAYATPWYWEGKICHTEAGRK